MYDGKAKKTEYGIPKEIRLVSVRGNMISWRYILKTRQCACYDYVYHKTFIHVTEKLPIMVLENKVKL